MTLSQFLRFEKFTGWHMLAIICLFFGVIISVNLTLAYYANSTWTGLVVKNSYVASQNFNEQTKKNHRFQALEWQTELNYDGQFLEVSIRDRANKPVVLTSLSAIIGRPTFEAEDHQVIFTRSGQGNYTTQNKLAPGIWQVQLDGIAENGQPWRRSIRFIHREK